MSDGNGAPDSNRPGDFIWYELLTADADAAQAFYGKVLNWSFGDSGQPGMDYRIISVGETMIAGLMQITPEMAQHGARPTWLGYLATDDVDKTAAEVSGRGGVVLMPPADVSMAGRIAMVADPQGAPIYLMTPAGEGRSESFAYDVPKIGHCAWNELHTTDQPGAWGFYGELFGWSQEGAMDMGPMGQYEFIRHGAMIGAIMKSPGGPSRWNFYFRVADIDAAKAAIEAGGGKVVQGPDEIPGGDYSLNAIDPQGASFGLVGRRG
jgi:uncharacterized protein